MRRTRSPEIVAGRVDANGSIIAGDGFVVQKMPTGLYIITITVPGFRLLAATITPQSAGTSAYGGGGAAPYLPTANSFGVNILVSNTGAGIDGMFSFIAVGAPR